MEIQLRLAHAVQVGRELTPQFLFGLGPQLFSQLIYTCKPAIVRSDIVVIRLRLPEYVV
jgi:hypothetical protein